MNIDHLDHTWGQTPRTVKGCALVAAAVWTTSVLVLFAGTWQIRQASPVALGLLWLIAAVFIGVTIHLAYLTNRYARGRVTGAAIAEGLRSIQKVLLCQAAAGLIALIFFASTWANGAHTVTGLVSFAVPMLTGGGVAALLLNPWARATRTAQRAASSR